MINRDDIVEKAIIGEPYNLLGVGNVYPITYKDYKEFSEYLKYIVFNKSYLGIPKDMGLLDGIISMGILSMKEYENMPNSKEESLTYSKRTILELIRLFELVLKKKVEYKFDIITGYNGFVVDGNVENTIDDSIYEELREVIMVQSLQFEPIVYEDPVIEKWAKKVRKARASKSKPLKLYDMLTILNVETGTSYAELGDYNLIQIYATYSRIINTKNYERTTLFKTVSSDIPDIEYAEGVIDSLFKNPEDDIFKGASSGKLSNVF